MEAKQQPIIQYNYNTIIIITIITIAIIINNQKTSILLKYNKESINKIEVTLC
jgi:hypothetical protein